jgi:putative redox protein
VTLKTARVRHEGALRFVAANDVGMSVVLDDRGGGAGPSPLEGMLGSLAACTAMDVISILVKKRQRVANYEIDVVADQRDDYPKIFRRIDLTHELEGPALDETAIRRAIFLSATKYCPVSAMLSAGPTELHHRFRMRLAPEDGGEGVEREDEVIVTGPYRSTEPVD